MEGRNFRLAIALICLIQVFRDECFGLPDKSADSSTDTGICPAAKSLSPTIKAFHPFNAKSDAKRLYKAVKGHGTDEQTIINILTHRTYKQRNEIAEVFYKEFGEYFRPWLYDDIGGVPGVIINSLMYPPTEILADHLLWAVKGAGTDEQTLIDILVPINAKNLTRVKTLFKQKSDLSLLKYVRSDTDDESDERDFQELLSALINIKRPDDGCVDLTKAEADAATLHTNLAKIKTKSLPDLHACQVGDGYIDDYEEPYCDPEIEYHKSLTSTLNRILASRSWYQLKKTFEIYKEKYGKSFGGDLPSKGLNYWYKSGLLAIHLYAMDSNAFFAEALHRDVLSSHYGVGWGNAYGVARVFAWRSEIDLGDIAKAYKVRYKKRTLLQWVRASMKGDAKNALIGILQ